MICSLYWVCTKVKSYRHHGGVSCLSAQRYKIKSRLASFFQNIFIFPLPACFRPPCYIYILSSQSSLPSLSSLSSLSSIFSVFYLLCLLSSLFSILSIQSIQSIISIISIPVTAPHRWYKSIFRVFFALNSKFSLETFGWFGKKQYFCIRFRERRSWAPSGLRPRKRSLRDLHRQRSSTRSE